MHKSKMYTCGYNSKLYKYFSFMLSLAYIQSLNSGKPT